MLQRDAAFDEVAQSDAPFHDDDGAGPLRGQQAGRDHELFDGLVVARQALEAAEDGRAAQVYQRPGMSACIRTMAANTT